MITCDSVLYGGTSTPGLKMHLNNFPRNLRYYNRTNIYVPTHLASCDYVWLKKEVKRSLESPYEGPFKVLSRDEQCKTLLLDRDGVNIRVNVDKVKPAWIANIKDENSFE